MPDGIAASPHVHERLHEPCLGYVVGRDEAGRALVRFAGAAAPVSARTLGSIADELDRAIERSLPVMLAFLEGRADAPVVMGIANLDDLPESARTPSAESPAIDLVVDGDRRVIEAREQLLLRCGEASILLRADGTVQIRGRDVTSWARRRQRIRGGSVAIN